MRRICCYELPDQSGSKIKIMKTPISRREFLKQGALVAGAVSAAGLLSACHGLKRKRTVVLPSGRRIASGPFEPAWDSLVGQYKCPHWFRDAKFGIWAHWT